MKADAEERERVNGYLLQRIESIGTIKYSRDATGKLKGVEIILKGSAEATAAGERRLTGPVPAR
jgi:hypothetical protein